MARMDGGKKRKRNASKQKEPQQKGSASSVVLGTTKNKPDQKRIKANIPEKQQQSAQQAPKLQSEQQHSIPSKKQTNKGKEKHEQATELKNHLVREIIGSTNHLPNRSAGMHISLNKPSFTMHLLL